MGLLQLQHLPHSVRSPPQKLQYRPLAAELRRLVVSPLELQYQQDRLQRSGLKVHRIEMRLILQLPSLDPIPLTVPSPRHLRLPILLVPRQQYLPPYLVFHLVVEVIREVQDRCLVLPRLRQHPQQHSEGLQHLLISPLDRRRQQLPLR